MTSKIEVSREQLRQEFEWSASDRAWFVHGGIVEDDTPEGFVYGDFTTDMCWTCYFEGRRKSTSAPLSPDHSGGGVGVVLPERDALHDLIAEVIGGDTYDCVRVWSAWGVGTMSEDDFVPFVDQDERLYELADAILDKVKELNQ